MSCAVVVEVKVQLTVELLAVVPVGLIHRLKAFSKQPAEGVVMVHLLHRAALAQYHPVVSLMVFQVVMVSWSGTGKSNVSFFREDHAQRAVFVYLVARIFSLCRCASRRVSYA
ncbi:hypothetical protein SDC9_138031 [bioreactor metagenome]|uniref:Uncharacterized protein n=1 Tax=bioreactor metagenome TaxID=1076179 RepID=A0A645DP74_9ZZZZ